MRLGRREITLGVASALAAPAGAAAAEPDVGARARWLAGTLALGPSSADWSAYAREEDARWQKSAARNAAVAAWATRELAGLPTDRPVFYPLAGADALHPSLLFKSAPRVILCGLEPIGDLPSPATAPPGTFLRLGKAHEDLHRLGFLRTQEMAADLAPVGVLPTLLGTIARLGGTVRSVHRASPTRVRVDFVAGDGAARRLDYVAQDLANAGLARAPELVAELRSLGPVTTFVKAGMYLLHEERFSYVRSLALEISQLVVQDDTGVPFRAFDARWAVRLYGRYTPPQKPFEPRRQRDLERAYAARRPPPLPFGFGYAMLPALSNLLVATRTA